MRILMRTVAVFHRCSEGHIRFASKSGHRSPERARPLCVRNRLGKHKAAQRQISNLDLSIPDEAVIEAGFGKEYRLFRWTRHLFETLFHWMKFCITL
jgi:hypothetical protein